MPLAQPAMGAMLRFEAGLGPTGGSSPSLEPLAVICHSAILVTAFPAHGAAQMEEAAAVPALPCWSARPRLLLELENSRVLSQELSVSSWAEVCSERPSLPREGLSLPPPTLTL